MGYSLYNKEEKRFASKKHLKKLKKENFLDYISYYETQLNSLKNSYDPKNDKNVIIEDLIEEMEIFVQDLYNYYYEKYLVTHEPPIPGQDLNDFSMEIEREIKKTVDPIDREIAKRIREIEEIESKNRY